ncbi:hypothetical protein EZS27_004625 [termite gut metagenome]|uniref:Uncharacterized protein n=1 Tax=termite gut metagenome TaxID=433724 RepID=A0A5J4SQ27_9ZZZZ
MNTDILKQALKNRVDNRELSSNFTYHVMQKVQKEAKRQHLWKQVVGWLPLIVACMFLIGLAVYVLVYDMKFNPADYMPHFNMFLSSSQIIYFYSYIGILTLGLLGLDYWFRKERSKSKDK